MAQRQTLDDLHGDTVVANLTLQCFRSGVMSVQGSVTDVPYVLAMLDTAREIVLNSHARRKLTHGDMAIIPAYDTALVGTPEEKLLLEARHQLADAM
jgi:hypothetical protein